MPGTVDTEAATVQQQAKIEAASRRKRPPPRGRYPKGLTARDRMERTLLTTRGFRLYTKRSQTVEPVF